MGKSKMEALVLSAPVERWDEALPLGNGRCGVLLWGGGRTLKLSLDRGDLWDERDGGVRLDPDWNWTALREIVRTNDGGRLARLDELAESMPATKLPVGRLEIDLPETWRPASFALDMAKARARVLEADGRELLTCFCRAESEDIYVKLAGPGATLRIVPPGYSSHVSKNDEPFTRTADSLGYAPGWTKIGADYQYVVQPCAAGLHYGIFVRQLTETCWVVNIKKADTRAEMERVIADFEAGKRPVASWHEAGKAHRAWWRSFWQRSAIVVPERAILNHYHFCRYLYGSGSRPGAPPMPLQGVWTADDNTLPPWRGDYHHDLNTQMTYLACWNSGDFDCAESFLRHLSDQMETYRAFARDFYGVANAVAVPGTATLAGGALGGWPHYSFSPTNSAWLAAIFAEHYRYTQDRRFLTERTWPFVRGVGELMLGLLETGEDGRYRLPLSSSPEIHDNHMSAFVKPTSNYDLALLARLFRDLRELALAIGNELEAEVWASHLKRLPAEAVEDGVGLKINQEENLLESHRHFSHLMAIYPLRLLDPHDERDSKIIKDSLHHLDLLGTGLWVGFSFSWAAAMAAACGCGDRALWRLREFLASFVSRNGFHINGDNRDIGLSAFKYRPFTLEGNFIAMQAVHEMLIGWRDGVLELLPGLPSTWDDVSFSQLRLPGGVSVSLEMKKRQIRRITLVAYCETSFELRLSPRYGWDKLTVNLPEAAKRKQELLALHLLPGQRISWKLTGEKI